MTEKGYKMVNTNLTGGDGLVYYNIKRDDGYSVCQVFGKNTARKIVDELNHLHEEKEYWKQKYKKPEVIINVDAKDIEETILKEIANLKEENKQLKSRLMVAEDKLHGLMNNE